MGSNEASGRNHKTDIHTSVPYGFSYGENGWGDGSTTAASPEGAARLALKSKAASNRVGFSGAQFRRHLGGPIGLILDFLFGKDPDIFDENGRVRHKFDDAKWKAWDDRIREAKDFNWHNHSGFEKSKQPKADR